MSQSHHEATSYFTAFNPATGKALDKRYLETRPTELAEIVCQSDAVFSVFAKSSYDARANLLDEIAQQIENLGDELLEICHQETALPLARLKGERGRTMAQLRMFAAHLREGEFVGAIIDRADPKREPIPKPDVRQMQVPIGPVAVFGASNFPLAFSTAGGDTASALAAGCPVVLKSHPAHPGTCALVTQAIHSALESTDFPLTVFQRVIGHSHQLSVDLVTQAKIAAVGFTGSLQAGRQLYNICQSRPSPIPFYGEMGSVNPVFVYPSALNKAATELANQYVNSLTLGVGQFCTNPGIIVGSKSPQWDAFKSQVADAISDCPSGTMLREGMADTYRNVTEIEYPNTKLRLLAKSESQGHETFSAIPQVWELDIEDIDRVEQWQTENFGPSSILINCESPRQYSQIVSQLDGQLTAALFADDDDMKGEEDLMFALSRKAGRIIFNSFPTGVEVCHAMHHGGPYPASTDSRSTSVGAQAILRFLKPLCFQDAPQSLLPTPLRD